MIKELTSEEVVTNLLISNGFIKSADNYKKNINNKTGLGAYLSKQNSLAHEVEKSRYSFINTSFGWKF